MRDLWNFLVREVTWHSSFFLPQQRRIAAERWLRGREEYRKLRAADYVLMSWGKSGRTWLRLMLSRFYQTRYNLPRPVMLGFDNLHKQDRRIPRIFFTHGNYLRNYTGHWDTKVDFYDKSIVMLVRDPRDIAVSQFFQWKYRMIPRKKLLNWYPAHGAEVGMFDFMMNVEAGLPCIIDFMNLWAREMSRIKKMLVVRYEDMRQQPGEALGRIVAFLGTPGAQEEIRDAVDFAAYENMKRLEESKVFWRSGARLRPGRRDNPDSYKVRRAKVGGYRDYFDDAQLAEIDALVNNTLAPSYGYGAEHRARGQQSSESSGERTEADAAPLRQDIPQTG